MLGVCARARACVCVCVCVRARARARACVCVCVVAVVVVWGGGGGGMWGLHGVGGCWLCNCFRFMTLYSAPPHPLFFWQVICETTVLRGHVWCVTAAQQGR